jgi:hypothetical protein
MHFFYLDETGCNGADLNPAQEPIFVLGGISVKDQGWVATTEAMEGVVNAYFGAAGPPAGFELHAHQLLSPNGEGPFAGHDRPRREALAFALLDLLHTRSHQVHLVAIDKVRLAAEADGTEHAEFDARVPYLLGFDYMVTAINHHVKERLGHTARGITIIDEKEMFEERIAAITRYRRSGVAKAHRVKWLVEFSYSIDSRKHPMIQLTDLVIYCAKKFLELDAGYRDGWPAPAKLLFARLFDRVWDRTPQRTLVPQGGKHAVAVNDLLGRVTRKPRHGWKNHHGIA